MIKHDVVTRVFQWRRYDYNTSCGKLTSTYVVGVMRGAWHGAGYRTTYLTTYIPSCIRKRTSTRQIRNHSYTYNIYTGWCFPCKWLSRKCTPLPTQKRFTICCCSRSTSNILTTFHLMHVCMFRIIALTGGSTQLLVVASPIHFASQDLLVVVATHVDSTRHRSNGDKIPIDTPLVWNRLSFLGT
jgi:hypothetical protein